MRVRCPLDSRKHQSCDEAEAFSRMKSSESEERLVHRTFIAGTHGTVDTGRVLPDTG